MVPCVMGGYAKKKFGNLNSLLCAFLMTVFVNAPIGMGVASPSCERINVRTNSIRRSFQPSQFILIPPPFLKFIPKRIVNRAGLGLARLTDHVIFHNHSMGFQWASGPLAGVRGQRPRRHLRYLVTTVTPTAYRPAFRP